MRTILLALLLALLHPLAVLADEGRAVPRSAEEIRLSFAPVVARAAPAVVNISASRLMQAPRSPFAGDPFFERFFGRGFGGGFGDPERRRIQASLGSGVIVSADGIVVTNHHVIDGADEVTLGLADKREFEADILLTDERSDLAVLKIRDQSAAPFPHVAFAPSNSLEVGDLVLAIGNPFGVGQTVTQGIVSALARTQVGVTDYRFFIQTDAAINPGNSGGALIDMTGRLVGINTAIYSRSGGSHGIGFAIPSEMAELVARAAANGGSAVARPWLGARMQHVTADIAEGLGLDRPRGALVTHVFRGGPAHEAGMRVGDLVIRVGGMTVEDPDGFGYHFALSGIGGTVDIDVMRSEREIRLEVRLTPAPETVPRDAREIDGTSPLAGATVMNLSPAVAEELDLPTFDVEGVVVARVAGGSIASRVGFRVGDRVLSVNGEAIGTTRRLATIARTRQRVWRIEIERGGRVVRLALRG